MSLVDSFPCSAAEIIDAIALSIGSPWLTDRSTASTAGAKVSTMGASVMWGYFCAPELTAERFDGDWFNTGDYIEDRKSVV